MKTLDFWVILVYWVALSGCQDPEEVPTPKNLKLPTISVSIVPPDTSNRNSVRSSRDQGDQDLNIFETKKLVPIRISEKSGKRLPEFPGNDGFTFTGQMSVLWVQRRTLELTCIAPYMTKWVSSIEFRRLTFVQKSQKQVDPEVKSDENIKEGELNSNFTAKIQFSANHGGSGYIKCVDVADSSKVSRLYVFTGNDSEGYPLQNPEEYVITKAGNSNSNEPFVIPCRTNYPVDANPEVQQKIGGKFVPIEPKEILNFDPEIGFKIQGATTGRTPPFYNCKLGNSNKEFEVIPVDPSMVAFDLEGVGDSRDNVLSMEPVEYYREDQSGLSIQGRWGGQGRGQGQGQGQKVKLNCTLGQPDGSSFLRNVSLNRTVRMIKCDEPYECQLRITQSTMNRNNMDVSFRRTCVDSPNHNEDCLLDLSYPRGIALCLLGPFVANQYFFTGLDREQYLLSQAIPTTALVSLQTPNQPASPHQKELFYSNEPYQFQCTIAHFLLRSEIKLILRFKNDTEVSIDANKNNNNNYNSNPDNPFPQQAFQIKLSKDVSKIGCRAPWYNSTTTWAQTFRQIEVKDTAPAEIDPRALTANKEFINGSSPQQLTCTATGEPKPRIMWEFKNAAENNTTTNHVKVKYEQNMEGSSIFEFLEVDYTVEGSYTCFARNAHGNDSFTFYVNVIEAPQPFGAEYFGMQMEQIITLTAVAGIILLLCILATVLGIKYYQARLKIRQLTDEEIQTFISGTRGSHANRNAYVSVGDEKADLSGSEKALQLPFTQAITDSDLFVDRNKILGKGEYGLVYSGLLLGEAVAIKTTKPSTETAHVKALLDEIKIMAFIGKHPNIITFLGAEIAKIHEKKIHVVLELSPMGNLHSYLRLYSREFIDLVNVGDGTPCARKIDLEENLSTLTMLDWCAQITDGMMFLQEKKVIHGDLATRNVLVFPNNILKITDFGLSRQLYYSTYTKKQKAPLPWRWMALESMRFMEFSTQSDVWSFGVTAWEIFSLAQLPYSAYTWDLDFMEKIDKGMRVGQPHMATRDVYEMMLKCWDNNPKERPSFAELKEFFLKHRSVINRQTNFQVTSDSRAKMRAAKTVSFESEKYN